MNWAIVVFVVVIGISVILVGLTLRSLAKLGDERKELIKMKAQSSAFAGVIGWMVIEIGRNIYVTTWTNWDYAGLNPFIVLIVISALYSYFLLFFKKKYGG